MKALNSLLSTANLVNAPIQPGDAGVILRADGSVHLFNTGQIDPDNLTDRQCEIAELLVAFAVLAKIPELRGPLVAAAQDPAVVNSLFDDREVQ